MPSNIQTLLSLLIVSFSICSLDTPAASDFSKDVLPILASKCFQCHGPESEKREAKLRLDTKEGLFGSTRDGFTIVKPNNLEKSELWWRLTEAETEDKMPPKDFPKKLTPVEITTIKQWIETGAPWEAHWSLEPIVSPKPPRVSNTKWIRNPIDAFVLEKLESMGISPSEEADRRTLIRRLTYDLHGLPPTPKEVDAFINDTHQDAYERLTDRLLASPRYGERWGRHWLDVAHYADTHGYDKDKRRENAWPYRDYVINALNSDKPYGQFIEEQIAGDILYPDDPQALVATGFITAGPWDFVGHTELREGTVDKKITRMLDRDDMVTSTMLTFTSMTVNCARCHDHKFDPITQNDYYALQAVFAGVERADRPYDIDPDVHQKRDELQQNKKALQTKINAIRPPETENKETLNEILTKADRRKIKKLERRLSESKDQLSKLPKQNKVYAPTTNFTPIGQFSPLHQIRDIHVLNRGEVKQPGAMANPGTVDFIPQLPSRFILPEGHLEGERRAQLAQWIAHESNPLTWRSIVNRLWHYHFGQGIVTTPNDFGRMGTPPSHRDLLDWLASELLHRGQSLKEIHRLMVTSATYRQQSLHNENYSRLDSSNQFLWRMNRRQLDAESIRDTIFYSSGKMDFTPGGPVFNTFEFEDDHSPRYVYSKFNNTDPDSFRRSVYRFIVRSVPDPLMSSLDCADPSQSVAVRNQTITAIQALAFLNNPMLINQTAYLAERVAAQSDDPSAQINYLFQLILNRLPTPAEMNTILPYAEKHGLPATCRVVLNTNEFIFVD